ncbi:hypothetical protein DRH14_03345 [Candidatus Shapirobacteria bacterium]|nr:MAG: hypothetical protein DRH14_03345 [Candidatus Shapirobacteria bacterium]
MENTKDKLSIPTPNDRRRNLEAVAIATIFKTTGGLEVKPKDSPNPFNTGIINMEGFDVKIQAHQNTLAEVLTQLNRNSGGHTTISAKIRKKNSPDVETNLLVNGQIPPNSLGKEQTLFDLLQSKLNNGNFKICEISITTPSDQDQEKPLPHIQLFIYGQEHNTFPKGTPLRICVNS